MSIRWIGVLAWVAPASLVWAMLAPFGLGWPSLLWLNAIGVMVLWVMHWDGIRHDRSIAQLLDDSDSDWRLCHNRLPRPYAQHR